MHLTYDESLNELEAWINDFTNYEKVQYERNQSIEIRIKLMLLTKINDKIGLSYCKRKFCILLIKKFLFPKKKKKRIKLGSL